MSQKHPELAEVYLKHSLREKETENPLYCNSWATHGSNVVKTGYSPKVNIKIVLDRY